VDADSEDVTRGRSDDVDELMCWTGVNDDLSVCSRPVDGRTAAAVDDCQPATWRRVSRVCRVPASIIAACCGAASRRYRQHT